MWKSIRRCSSRWLRFTRFPAPPVELVCAWRARGEEHFLVRCLSSKCSEILKIFFDGVTTETNPFSCTSRLQCSPRKASVLAGVQGAFQIECINNPRSKKKSSCVPQGTKLTSIRLLHLQITCAEVHILVWWWCYTKRSSWVTKNKSILWGASISTASLFCFIYCVCWKPFTVVMCV